MYLDTWIEAFKLIFLPLAEWMKWQGAPDIGPHFGQEFILPVPVFRGRGDDKQSFRSLILVCHWL